MCHTLVAVAFVVAIASGAIAFGAIALVACAPSQGWSRGAAVCEAEGPGRLCVRAAPDQAIEVFAGDEVVLPGECALAPGAGWVRLRVRDGHGHIEHRRVRVARGRRVEVTVQPDRIRVDRARCDRTPVP